METVRVEETKYSKLGDIDKEDIEKFMSKGGITRYGINLDKIITRSNRLRAVRIYDLRVGRKCECPIARAIDSLGFTMLNRVYAIDDVDRKNRYIDIPVSILSGVDND